MSKPPSFWRSVPAIVLGIVGGVFLLIALRVEYYDVMNFQPNMAPQIAYVFSPIILAVALVVALPLEAVLRRLGFKPQTFLQQLAVGAAHATSISWWAFPAHWLIVFIANPIVLRWVLGLIFRSRATRAAGGEPGRHSSGANHE